MLTSVSQCYVPVLTVLAVCVTISTSLFLHPIYRSDVAGVSNSVDDPLEPDPRVLPRDVPVSVPACPAAPPRFPYFFNASCTSHQDCEATLGRTRHLCCPVGQQKLCLPAVLAKYNPDPLMHKPLLGIPRYCPTTEHLHEFLPVRNCTSDGECEPRICCPDGLVSYCRTAVPRLSPRSSHAARVLLNLVSYLQCTPPPPPSLDLFPKTCKYSFDCFPNICCQEKGRKVCRPAKKSILRLLASLNF